MKLRLEGGILGMLGTFCLLDHYSCIPGWGSQVRRSKGVRANSNLWSDERIVFLFQNRTVLRTQCTWITIPLYIPSLKACETRTHRILVWQDSKGHLGGLITWVRGESVCLEYWMQTVTPKCLVNNATAPTKKSIQEEQNYPVLFLPVLYPGPPYYPLCSRGQWRDKDNLQELWL